MNLQCLSVKGAVLELSKNKTAVFMLLINNTAWVTDTVFLPILPTSQIVIIRSCKHTKMNE